jgi:hypothetical protein
VGAGADLRSGFAAGFLIFFFAADLAVLLLFVLAVVRGDFLGPAFVTAACRERFDEVAAFARFLAAGVRDLVLAGDLRAGFLTMVILVIRYRRGETRCGTRWGRRGKPQIISSGYESRVLFPCAVGTARRTISS